MKQITEQLELDLELPSNNPAEKYFLTSASKICTSKAQRDADLRGLRQAQERDEILFPKRPVLVGDDTDDGSYKPYHRR